MNGPGAEAILVNEEMCRITRATDPGGWRLNEVKPQLFRLWGTAALCPSHPRRSPFPFLVLHGLDHGQDVFEGDVGLERDAGFEDVTSAAAHGLF